MSDAKNSAKIGLLTKDALSRLKNDISTELNSFKTNRISSHWLVSALSPWNQNALVVWPTVCVSLLYGLLMLLASILGEGQGQAGTLLPLQAVLLWLITLANLLLVYSEDRLSKDEIPRRILYSLGELDRAAAECCWTEANYPHLCAPFSPCVTLQWTYRDGKLVNLPWALLVEGDVVLLRPGQEAPGHCRSPDEPPLLLQPRQFYQPAAASKEVFGSPRVTQPHRNKLFEMTETPYVSNLRLALTRALGRPVTVHNKQRHLVIIKCMEGVLLPTSVVLCLLATLIYQLYLRERVGRAHWSTAFLLQTVATTLPLLPTAYPVVWTALNIYGMSKFKHLLQSSVKQPAGRAGSVSEGICNPLLNRGAGESNEGVWATCLSILLGREDLVTRSANIVHVLGSVSALCCVDKKGILSWPNPTAEKVFFLRNSSSISRSSSKTSFMGSSGHLSGQPEGSLTTIPHLTPTTVAEVLDLTHDQNVPFKLEFDDHTWKNHLSCLKPLGLAILVNTCNIDTQEHYTNFCSHLTCEATQSEDVVPVTNRRCLCELAKQIGFVEEAKSIYTLQTHLATFRHLPPEVIRRDTRFARSLHLSTRVKVPLPHMLGVVIRDQAGGLQLITQGTADIILDSCVEYWNGQDLCVLSPSDRKKVLDFYQRSSLTAYCSAFAYRPLTRGVCPRLSALYLELPADCRSLYPNTPWSEPHPPLTSHYHSTDSLLFNDFKEEDATDVEGYFDLQCSQVFIGMVTMQYQAQSDMVELIERLDRACIRFVHFSKENELRSRVFSEKMGLESGWNCHISLSSDDNRPASPTTSQNLPTPSCSEKAWRGAGGKPYDRGDSCGEEGITFLHSNLASSKPLSNSAPGAINLDHSTVKFDNEASHVRYDTRDDSIISTHQGNMPSGQVSQDSVLLGGWEGEAGGVEVHPGDATEGPEGCRSLSCLTDSTDHSAPVNFDMRNRAKLPRGIDNIRPHIEQVDNVPLLVSLFTDCTASTARRMLSIMQEYGQVVCVMGSAANKDNMEIFMQADASIAVEPLYPVLCQKVPPFQLPTRGPGPIDLARTLNSIPCSISESRESDISLFSLVTLARHLMLALWSASQYWICALCSLTLLQLLCLMCGVPQILSVGAVLWEIVVVIPAVATTLALGPMDSTVMANATNKLHTRINLKMCLFVMWCYGYKFLPFIIIVLASYITILGTFCREIVQVTNGTECISLLYPRKLLDNVTSGNYTSNEDYYENLEWRGWGDVNVQGYMLAQQTAFLMTTILLLTISVCFVHRQHSLWRKSILLNKVWCICVSVLFTLQMAYWSLMSFLVLKSPSEEGVVFYCPLPHIVVLFTSPLLVLAINEIIKWQEIKANLRYQRRARLDFGTKLGMNSPF